MMKTQRIAGLFLAFFVLVAMGCAGSASTRSTGTYLDDKAISTKVKTQLAVDSLTSAMQIEVETYNGVVQLSGFVDSSATADRAGNIARGVEGVKEVKNYLLVRKQ